MSTKVDINVDYAERDAEIIRLRREQRMVPRKICEVLGIHQVEIVRDVLAKYVKEVRARNVEIIETAFVEQNETIEHLLALVHKQLANGYDRDAIKCAIMLLERQAKLLGLDRAMTSNAAAKNDKDWIEKASDTELIEEARRLGLPMPEQFGLIK